MPSGILDMRPLAVEGIGELAFTGEGLLLTEECGEAGGTGVVISVSLLLWFWLGWCSKCPEEMFDPELGAAGFPELSCSCVTLCT